MSVQADRTPPLVRAGGEAPRLLVVGASTDPVCGVRDYARVVGDALRKTGAEVEFAWWERDLEWSLRSTRSAQKAWLEQVADRVRCGRPDWIVWHYSVFAWASRGIPLLTSGTARGLGRLGVPILLIAHELVFPFARLGWKGSIWAATQRFGLLWPVRASRAVIVTTQDRLGWLESRRWLPTRPARFLPVCSNLPTVAARPSDGDVAGVVGFGTERALAQETMQALARLRTDGIDLHARLIGAPGDVGDQADRWRAAAREVGMDGRLEFTGVVPAQALATFLTEAEVVILPDPGGPSSRRGVVAAALALAKPLVAVDGPERWQELVDDLRISAGKIRVCRRVRQTLPAANTGPGSCTNRVFTG